MPRIRRLFTIVVAVVLVGYLPTAGVQADELADRAAIIKPAAEELGWLKIPWVLDLNSARMTAKAEGRPLFLWATGDDPLERC